MEFYNIAIGIVASAEKVLYDSVLRSVCLITIYGPLHQTDIMQNATQGSVKILINTVALSAREQGGKNLGF